MGKEGTHQNITLNILVSLMCFQVSKDLRNDEFPSSKTYQTADSLVIYYIMHQENHTC